MATRKEKPERDVTTPSDPRAPRRRRDRVPPGLPLQVDLAEHGATPDIRAAARAAMFKIEAAADDEARRRAAPDRLLREKEVEKLTGLSRSTIRRREREGEFPKHVQISKNVVGWHESEVRSFIRSRKPRSEA